MGPHKPDLQQISDNLTGEECEEEQENEARDLRPSQLDPETRSQPARDRRLDTARDNSLFPFVIRRSQLQLAFPIPARTARDPFQL
ncbi:hypothetical protein DY000_02047509 [Brassica cretica]|uniref:Uncharacterized protein n=1 Tax=Brassica cretica TaxID=69181 RepID=A0ABQ7F5B5_BRACR|nr:hypothetical protein DY000_02047509 [Brassica cretica]